MISRRNWRRVKDRLLGMMIIGWTMDGGAGWSGLLKAGEAAMDGLWRLLVSWSIQEVASIHST